MIFLSEGLVRMVNINDLHPLSGYLVQADTYAQVGICAGLHLAGRSAEIGKHEAVQIARPIEYTGRKGEVH
jgi:hypothetical protein